MRTKTLSLLRAVWALNCCISLESIAPGLGSQRVPFNACWLGGSGSSKPGTKDLISMSPPLEWQLPAMSWSREAAASLPRWTAFREPLVTGLLSSGPLLLWRYLYRNLLPKHVRHSLPPLLPKVWATSRLEAFHHRCGFQTSPVHILGHQGYFHQGRCQASIFSSWALAPPNLSAKLTHVTLQSGCVELDGQIKTDEMLQVPGQNFIPRWQVHRAPLWYQNPAPCYPIGNADMVPFCSFQNWNQSVCNNCKLSANGPAKPQRCCQRLHALGQRWVLLSAAPGSNVKRAQRCADDISSQVHLQTVQHCFNHVPHLGHNFTNVSHRCLRAKKMDFLSVIQPGWVKQCENELCMCG